jgi:hypothetical protein
VLVLETIGPVEGFIGAVRKIEGLEWLTEFEGPELPPAYGFEAISDPERQLPGQLFLVATDQQALQQIVGLFRLWQDDPSVRMEHGLNSLKSVFAHLYDIRPWDMRDRIRESGVIEDWENRIAEGQATVPFEAELWFRQSLDQRTAAIHRVSEVIAELGGEVLNSCVIEGIGYHALLGQIPTVRFEEIAELNEIRLLRCEDMMYLRPVGQCSVRTAEDDVTSPLDIEIERNLPTGNPVAALLDGLPLTGHVLLQNRLIVDDPDSFEDAYQAQQRRHGTSMASLICHGDLNEQEEPLNTPLYVRPIMVPRNDVVEQIPEGILPVDLVHRSVRRMFESEGDEPAAAPTVRIINLSIGDYARPFFREMSPWARLLDWLAVKYNIIFIISSGNHLYEVELGTARADFASLSAGECEAEFLSAISNDTRNRKILSPSESINGLTIGAIHDDASPDQLPVNLINPLQQANLPASFNGHGPGFRRAIKPDILLPGGRQLFSERMGNTHSMARLTPVNTHRAPGQLVASTSPLGETDRVHYVKGTSNAAASATRWGVRLFESIDSLRNDYGADIPIEYDAVLVKTLLTHGAEWSDARQRFEEVFGSTISQHQMNEHIARFLGYGVSDVAKVMECTEQLVTVLGIGQLSDGQGHEFRFPLPPSLSASAEKRRLTITLGWVSPVLATRQKYRLARLWFDPRNILAGTRINADYRAVKRGTLQHEVLEGSQVLDFQDGEDILIKVNCRADAGRLLEPVRYGLAVTLEVAPELDIPLYQEVRERLVVRVPIVR